MKKALFLLILVLAAPTGFIQAQPAGWKIVEGKITTPWAAKVNPANPLPEYPRPQMVRENWMSLNGLWEYALQPKAQSETRPTAFSGNILVPYAVESALSGVGKTLGKDSVLWYQRTVTLPAKLRKGNVLLHFGAVDWQCDVYVNGQKAGTHQGGYDPFSFDITSLLGKGNNQEISLRAGDKFAGMGPD